jgi:hypothetical protein
MVNQVLNPLIRFAAPIVLGACLAADASAFETMLGDYEGKIRNLSAYRGKVGDVCRVTVARSDLYGGAVSFEIRGAEKLLVEERRVAKDYRPGVPEASWVTPGGTGRPGELVGTTFRNDGSLMGLKLLLKDAASHQVKFIVCGDLRRVP